MRPRVVEAVVFWVAIRMSFLCSMLSLILRFHAILVSVCLFSSWSNSLSRNGRICHPGRRLLDPFLSN